MSAVLVFWGWSLTALSGVVVLGAWLATPTVRRVRTAKGRHRRLPPALVFSHVGAAASGLLVWSTFTFWDQRPFAWLGLLLITVTATLGLTMFVRWIPTYRLRSRPGESSAGIAPPRTDARRDIDDGRPRQGRHRAEPRQRSRQNLPLTVVLVHGLFAVTTVALMVVTIAGLVG